MSETQKQILYQYKKLVNLAKVGGIMTTDALLFAYDKDSYFSIYMDDIMKTGIAMTILYHIGGGTEGDLLIRDLSPKLDFMENTEIEKYTNEYGFTIDYHKPNRIETNEWKQVYRKENMSELSPNRYSYYAYSTSKDVKNDQKIIIIYGIENLGYTIEVDEIQFWRGTSKLEHSFIPSSIGRIQNMISPLPRGLDMEKEKVSDGFVHPYRMIYHNPVAFFNYPVVYKLNDLAAIKFIINKPGGRDFIKLRGLVFEHKGLNF